MEAATGAWAEMLGTRFAFSRCHPVTLVSFVLLRFEHPCAPSCCVQRLLRFPVISIGDQFTIDFLPSVLRMKSCTKRIGQATSSQIAFQYAEAWS